MDVKNINLYNFTFTGGDDCIAIKPRSYNVHVSNITCNGGNGIAIAYLEDSIVEDVVIENARVPATRFGTYIKTWMGHLAPLTHYESAGLPRGGGWGFVRNITFRNVDVDSAQRGLLITQDNGDNGSFAGTSQMGIEDVLFQGYRGRLGAEREEVYVDCSRVHPCTGIRFEDVRILSQSGGGVWGDLSVDG
ncbi:pectin lyase fold/virulence factor [Aspergillus crustosus]